MKKNKGHPFQNTAKQGQHADSHTLAETKWCGKHVQNNAEARLNILWQLQTVWEKKKTTKHSTATNQDKITENRQTGA